MRIRSTVIRSAISFIAVVAVLDGCTFWPLRAQPPKNEAIVFFGRVAGISTEKNLISVKHGKISGYVGPGTTRHTVGKASVLERLRAGDDISAVVYTDDLTLYHIHVVYRRSVSTPAGAK